MNRSDVTRLVWAYTGRAGTVLDDDPEIAINRFLHNSYPGGLAAVRAELDLTDTRDELIDLLAWRGRERWATTQKRRAARAAIDAGCPLRIAAEAAGVTHQTIANWAQDG